MTKTTYFTGAGSSFNSLPLIKSMNNRMKVFSAYLKLLKDTNNIDQNNLNLFIKEFDTLIVECEKSNSIDSYAKELSNRNDSLKLHHLKLLLSSYLIFEQLIKSDEAETPLHKLNKIGIESSLLTEISKSLDPRYRSFWGNYISSEQMIPDSNIKVISWNYDMQFESAYSEAIKCSLELTQQNIQVYPSPINDISISKFCLIKLNGTAGLYSEYPHTKLGNNFDLKKHHLDNFNINILINEFAKNYNRIFVQPIFSFAWENNKYSNQARNYAQKIITTSDVIVVIGYSFPKFNKEIDKELFLNWDLNKRLYLQVSEGDFPMVKYRMEGIKKGLGNSVIPIFDLYEFHIPNEN